jgi:DNA recombination-mediator protein A
MQHQHDLHRVPEPGGCPPPETVCGWPVVASRPKPAGDGEMPCQHHVICRRGYPARLPYAVLTAAWDCSYEGGSWISCGSGRYDMTLARAEAVLAARAGDFFAPYAPQQRRAIAAVTALLEPADPVLGALVATDGPERVLDWIKAGNLPADVAGTLGRAGAVAAQRSLARCAARLPLVPAAEDLGRWEDAGIRLLCPGDAGWPQQLNDLRPRAPYALWVRGDRDLASISERSVAMVGSRAATGYGAHVAAGIQDPFRTLRNVAEISQITGYRVPAASIEERA